MTIWRLGLFLWNVMLLLCPTVCRVHCWACFQQYMQFVYCHACDMWLSVHDLIHAISQLPGCTSRMWWILQYLCIDYNLSKYCPHTLSLSYTHTHTCVHTPVHSYHAHTIQVDTARVEKQTFVCTEKKSDAVPSPEPGVVSKLGNWKSPKEMDVELNEKFKGCMKGMESFKYRQNVTTFPQS